MKLLQCLGIVKVGAHVEKRRIQIIDPPLFHRSEVLPDVIVGKFLSEHLPRLIGQTMSCSNNYIRIF